MRHPTTSFLTLADVPLDLAADDEEGEYYGPGLCCPDDPIDSLGIYVDSALLDSSPSLCSVADVGDGTRDMEVTARGGGGLETSSALAGRRLHVPQEAITCSMLLPSKEARLPPVSPFDSSTVMRRRRRGLVTVRRHAWSETLPSNFVNVEVEAHPKHGDHRKENNEEKSATKVNGGGGKRRSAGPKQRNLRLNRKCAHCSVEETPQWRAGPDGAGTLCNACGIRYSMGKDKLVPEYRPSTSPSFRSKSKEHSNRDRKVRIIRKKSTRFLKVDDDDQTGDRLSQTDICH